MPRTRYFLHASLYLFHLSGRFLRSSIVSETQLATVPLVHPCMELGFSMFVPLTELSAPPVFRKYPPFYPATSFLSREQRSPRVAACALFWVVFLFPCDAGCPGSTKKTGWWSWAETKLLLTFFRFRTLPHGFSEGSISIKPSESSTKS